MPNGEFFREVFEESSAAGGYWEVASIAFRARVSLAGLKPAHQIHRGAISQRDLLMTPTNAEHRLRGFLDYFNYTGQRFGSVSVPGMTLPTQNDMRRTKRLDAFE